MHVRNATLGVLAVGCMAGTTLIAPAIAGAAKAYPGCKATSLRAKNLSGCDLRKARGLTRANLSGKDLSRANLSGTNLYATNLSRTKLVGANLALVRSGRVAGRPASLPRGWRLSRGYLIGPRAVLIGANLAGLDLTRANLSGANLRGADVADTDFSEAALNGVASGSLEGEPASLPEAGGACPDRSWTVNSGYLVGPRANLSRAELSGADLTDACAAGANFSSADLTDATLAGAIATNANFSRADLSRAKMRSANAMRANFGLANLSEARLTFTKISYANLTRANLATAVLTWTQISGAIFSSADFTDISSYQMAGKPGRLPSGWTIVSGKFFPDE